MLQFRSPVYKRQRPFSVALSSTVVLPLNDHALERPRRRARNLPISGRLLREQALVIAEDLNISAENFKALALLKAFASSKVWDVESLISVSNQRQRCSSYNVSPSQCRRRLAPVSSALCQHAASADLLWSVTSDEDENPSVQPPSTARTLDRAYP